MEPLRITLHNAQQGGVQLQRLCEVAKAHLIAGRRLVVTLKPATRTDEMNARLHATISDVAKQVEWAGQKRDVETWKRLLVAAWSRVRGEPLDYLPALDGHGVDIVFHRTSKMTQAQVSDLCEFIYAWGVDHGVKFTAPEREYA